MLAVEEKSSRGKKFDFFTDSNFFPLELFSWSPCSWVFLCVCLSPSGKLFPEQTSLPISSDSWSESPPGSKFQSHCSKGSEFGSKIQSLLREAASWHRDCTHPASRLLSPGGCLHINSKLKCGTDQTMRICGRDPSIFPWLFYHINLHPRPLPTSAGMSFYTEITFIVRITYFCDQTIQSIL